MARVEARIGSMDMMGRLRQMLIKDTITELVIPMPTIGIGAARNLSAGMHGLPRKVKFLLIPRNPKDLIISRECLGTRAGTSTRLQRECLSTG
jgi:hypothetical protein